VQVARSLPSRGNLVRLISLLSPLLSNPRFRFPRNHVRAGQRGAFIDSRVHRECVLGPASEARRAMLMETRKFVSVS
jgi:hypothetical protein